MPQLIYKDTHGTMHTSRGRRGEDNRGNSMRKKENYKGEGEENNKQQQQQGREHRGVLFSEKETQIVLVSSSSIFQKRQCEF